MIKQLTTLPVLIIAGYLAMSFMALAQEGEESREASSVKVMSYNVYRGGTSRGQPLSQTAKHHEGFCLWDSQYTDFDVANTPFKGRDILNELSQACKQHGIRFGLYYSIIDWNHPSQKRPSELGRKGGTGRARWPGYTRIVDDRKQEYVDYQKNQVLELLKKYDPAMLWFDGDWAAWWTMQDGLKLYRAIRKTSPHVIVNNRVAKRDGFELDFVTQEQKHFSGAFPKHWEGCYTMNKSWGYKKHDHAWKNAQTV